MQWKSCGSARALSRRQKLREGRHQAAGPPVDRHHPDRFAGRDGTVPGDTPQEDDVTLVVLEKNKQGKGPSSPLRRGRPDGVLLTSRVSPHACNVLGSKPRKDPQAEKGSSTPDTKAVAEDCNHQGVSFPSRLEARQHHTRPLPGERHGRLHTAGDGRGDSGRIAAAETPSDADRRTVPADRRHDHPLERYDLSHLHKSFRGRWNRGASGGQSSRSFSDLVGSLKNDLKKGFSGLPPGPMEERPMPRSSHRLNWASTVLL